MEKRKEATPEAAEQREKLRKAIAFKSYEFNCHGVEMNQRYRSSAIASDGTPEPTCTRDAELYYHATTWPGATLPHVWFDRDGEQVSSLDVVGRGRFVLLTGIGGEAWVEAAKAIAVARGIPLEAFIIGPGRDLTDIFGDWAEAREVSETGAILVRPDQHVCFRAHAVSADAQAQLDAALTQVLGQAG